MGFILTNYSIYTCISIINNEIINYYLLNTHFSTNGVRHR